MTTIASHHDTGIAILTHDIGEGVVACSSHMSTTHATLGIYPISALGYCRPLFPGMIRLETLSSSSWRRVSVKSNSSHVPAADRFERERPPSGQALIGTETDASRAHESHRSRPLHPDWRESSGIALPTVEELHYAHHFLRRVAERRLKEALPASAPPPFKPLEPQSVCSCYGKRIL